MIRDTYRKNQTALPPAAAATAGASGEFLNNGDVTVMCTSILGSALDDTISAASRIFIVIS